MDEIRTLGDELPKEMARVRKLIIQYRNPLLTGAGNMAALMMEQSLRRADEAVISGDLGLMIAAYQDLKEYGD